jgi:hypothetical protein
MRDFAGLQAEGDCQQRAEAFLSVFDGYSLADIAAGTVPRLRSCSTSASILRTWRDGQWARREEET